MPTLRQTAISAACLLGALASVPTAWAAAPVFGGGAVASASVDENNATSYDFSATDADAEARCELGRDRCRQYEGAAERCDCR